MLDISRVEGASDSRFLAIISVLVSKNYGIEFTTLLFLLIAFPMVVRYKVF
jgi:hypothetical protein